MLLAFQSDMARFAPHAQLAAVTHHWGGFYTRMAQAVLDGRWAVKPVWGGLKDGMVQLTALNPALPAQVRAGLAQRQRAIEDGKLLPFAAPLVDNTGHTRLARGALDDTAIAHMDWLVQGVAGRLPAR